MGGSPATLLIIILKPGVIPGFFIYTLFFLFEIQRKEA